MHMSLGERIDHAKSLRDLLQAGVSTEVDSEVVHAPHLVGDPDDDHTPDDLSEDALFPRLGVPGPMYSTVTVDFLPTRIVIRMPKRLGRGSGEHTHVVPIGEGIGLRTVVEETDEQIVERIRHHLADLRKRAQTRDLRQVRKELAVLKKREAQLVAAASGLKSPSAPVAQ